MYMHVATSHFFRESGYYQIRLKITLLYKSTDLRQKRQGVANDMVQKIVYFTLAFLINAHQKTNTVSEGSTVQYGAGVKTRTKSRVYNEWEGRTVYMLCVTAFRTVHDLCNDIHVRQSPWNVIECTSTDILMRASTR